MSSTVRDVGSNIYCTFVTVLNAIFSTRRFVEKRINIQQIMFIKNDDIICMALSFGFFIFNTTDMRM